MSLKKYTIAIDGPAASGKSTTAKILAKELGYIYIDTGAMYRAVTLAVINNNGDVNNFEQALNIAQKSKVELKIIDGTQHTFLNENDVSTLIRTPQIDAAVSAIATNAAIRGLMVQAQREMAKQGGIVMDGRDIGTVVLPNADLKVFMQASIEARAKRRLKDQQNHAVSLKEIKKDIERRDYADTHRKEGPLKKANDAVVLDNSHLTIEEQVQKIQAWIENLH